MGGTHIKGANILARIGLDWFIVGIVLMVAAAYVFPAAGLAQTPVSLEKLATYGISGIFFFYGLKLDFAKIRAGLSNWKLHLVVQSVTFLVFPCIALAIKPLFQSAAAAPFWAGTLFLCALPSTVSSSVVMVSIARGNMPAAIFNASISSLIGIFMTPFWVKMYLPGGHGVQDAWGAVGSLFVQVLLPVCLGIALNSRLGSLAEKYKNGLKKFDQAIILTIIYTSFCKSFSLGIFKDISWLTLLVLAAAMLLLFLIVLLAVQQTARILRFSTPDMITAMFCGSKKSLVHGTVMVKVLFAGSSANGILLLPLMLYHALQLITASILAQKMARRTTN